MCTYYCDEDFLDDDMLCSDETIFDLYNLKRNIRKDFMLNMCFPNLPVEEKLVDGEVLLLDIYINSEYLFKSNVLKDVTFEDIHKFVKYINRNYTPVFKRLNTNCILDNFYSLDSIVNSKSDNETISKINDKLFYCFMEIRDNI